MAAKMRGMHISPDYVAHDHIGKVNITALTLCFIYLSKYDIKFFKYIFCI